MAIVNRDLDPSQQKVEFQYVGATQISTGYTSIICKIDYPCTIQSASSFALGVSTAMQVALQVWRFTSAGLTIIIPGVSNMVLNNYGTSGILAYSGLAPQGSSLLQLQQGDAVGFATSGANAAATNLVLDVVLKKTQDIVATNGVQT